MTHSLLSSEFHFTCHLMSPSQRGLIIIVGKTALPPPQTPGVLSPLPFYPSTQSTTLLEIILCICLSPPPHLGWKLCEIRNVDLSHLCVSSSRKLALIQEMLKEQINIESEAGEAKHFRERDQSTEVAAKS